MRVVFVDDEKSILDSLHRMLVPQTNDWQMFFCTSGEEAIDILHRKGGDVLVTDLQMPGMSGKSLLYHVHTQYPDMVRIILSGMNEGELDMRKVPIAHLYLEKPCAANDVKKAIERAFSLRQILNTTEIQQLFNMSDDTLRVPWIYVSLTNALTNSKTTAHEIAAIIEQNASLTQQLIDFANSSILRLNCHPKTLKDAIASLGFRMIKDVALSLSFFEIQEQAGDVCCDSDDFYPHAMRVAKIAQELAPNDIQRHDLLLAALLHDIGKWVIAILNPARYRQTVQQAKQDNISFYEAECDLYNTSHAEIGAYLLEQWGLTYPVIEGVACHHDLSRLPTDKSNIASAIFVADALIRKAPIDAETLTRFGIQKSIDDLQKLASAGV